MSDGPVKLLPYKWEARRNSNGKWFFVNHAKQTTQWSPPTMEDWQEAEKAKREDEQRQVQESRSALFGTSPSPAGSSSYTEGEPLPYKWEARKHTDGRWFFINHLTKQTQWTPPSPADWRLAKAAEREAQAQEAAATSSPSTSMDATTFTTQTNTLTETQKRAMRRHFHEKYSAVDASIVDAVLDSINYDENVATGVLDDIAGAKRTDDDDDDDDDVLWSINSASSTKTSPRASTLPTAAPFLPSTPNATTLFSRFGAGRTSSRAQQQQRRTESSAATGAATAGQAEAAGAVGGGGENVQDMTTRVDAILSDSQFADTLGAWSMFSGGEGSSGRTGRGHGTSAATAGDLDLGLGFGLDSDLSEPFGGADISAGKPATGGYEAEGGLGYELPASDAFASDMAAMADLFSTELAEQEQTMASPFGDAEAAGTRTRTVPAGARGSAGTSGARTKGGAGATGSGLARGTDPSLRRGADRSLLLQRVVQPRGPNPAFRSKPGSSLAKGRNASLARGANRSLARGPAGQRLR